LRQRRAVGKERRGGGKSYQDWRQNPKEERGERGSGEFLTVISNRQGGKRKKEGKKGG